MNVEDNRHVYKGKDAFLWLPTSFSKSVRYKVPSFACLTINNAIGVQGGVAICRYLVSLAIGVIMIAKFNGVNNGHHFVIALFSALYVCHF